MKILITGANGFVGKALLQELSRTEHELFGLDILPGAASGIKRFYCQDLTKPFALTESFDFVFHLAAYNLTHVGATDTRLYPALLKTAASRPRMEAGLAPSGSRSKGAADPRVAYEQINVQGTKNLLTACRTRNLIFLSTAKVYRSEGKLLSEDSPTGPVAEYEKSKLAAEEICREHFSGDSLNIFRSVNIAGPGQSLKAIIPVFFERARNGREIDVFAPRETVLQFLDVVDVIELFKLVVAHNSVKGLFNLAGPEEVRIDALARRIGKLCGPKSTVKFSGSGQAQFSKVVSDKVAEALGWKAKIGVNAMLEKYLKSLGER